MARGRPPHRRARREHVIFTCNVYYFPNCMCLLVVTTGIRVALLSVQPHWSPDVPNTPSASLVESRRSVYTTNTLNNSKAVNST